MRLLVTAISLFIATVAHAERTLTDVQQGVQNEHFIADFNFGGAIEAGELAIEFDNNGAFFIVPEANLVSEKNLVKVGSNGIKSILSTKTNTGMVRAKVFFEDKIDPSTMKESVQLLTSANGIKLIVKKPEMAWSNAVLGLPDFTPQGLDVVAQVALDDTTISSSLPEKNTTGNKVTLSNAADVAGVQTEANSSTGLKAEKNNENLNLKKNQKESDIPVLTKVETKKAQSSGTVIRLIMSFAVIIAAGFGLMAFGKWYQKRGQKEIGNNQIRILTQHYLGPRKSLAIVRVAGETILIGVTDQNISMLKSLALIDDEIPESVPRSFSSEMNTKMKQESLEEETDAAEEFILGSMKNKLTSKLKNLRPLA